MGAFMADDKRRKEMDIVVDRIIWHLGLELDWLKRDAIEKIIEKEIEREVNYQVREAIADEVLHK